MNAEITRQEDVRASKEMDLPLDTPIELRFFSEAYSKNYFRVVNATGKFMATVCEPKALTAGKWKLVSSRLGEIIVAVHSVDRFIDRRAGRVYPPVFGCDQDEDEYDFLSSVLANHAIPFIEFWQRASPPHSIATIFSEHTE